MKIKEGDSLAREEFVRGNLRLVLSVIQKFSSRKEQMDDLFQVGCIGLIKAINTFKSDKNIKLATYASRCIENEILMHIRKTGTQRNEISIDEPLNVDWDGNELLLSDILGNEEDGATYELDQREERQSVLLAVSHLPERERIIIEMRYGLGEKEEMTQKEVADLLGISQSYISRLEKKILKKLRFDILDLI